MINTYSECGVVGLAVAEEGFKIGLKGLYLCSVLFIGEVDLLKLSGGIVEVAWVDAYLLYMESRLVCRSWVEVNIGRKRDLSPFCPDLCLNGAECLGFFGALGGEAY